MKWVKSIIAIGCVLAVCYPANAGNVRVRGSIRNRGGIRGRGIRGRGSVGRRSYGRGTYSRRGYSGSIYRGRGYSSGIVFRYDGDDWHVRVRSGSYGRPYRYGRYGRYGGYGSYYGGSSYYYWPGSTVIVTDPYVYDVTPPPVVMTDPNGVFVVPVDPLPVVTPRVVLPRAEPTKTFLPPLKKEPTAKLSVVRKKLQKGDLNGASARMKMLLRTAPSDAQFNYVHSYILTLRGNYASAIFLLRRGVMLDSAMASAGADELTGHFDAKRAANAIGKLDKHVEKNPDDMNARFLRGYMRLLSGESKLAKADFQAVLTKDDADSSAKRFLDICSDRIEAEPKATDGPAAEKSTDSTETVDKK